MQLSELPQTVQSLIEARTGDAVFVVAPDYSIAYWDEQAQFLTGFTAEEMVGRRCYEAILGERESGEPFCSYGCSVMRLAQVGRPITSYDMRVRTPSGEKRWVSVSILSLESEKGPYLVHLLRDSQNFHETLEMAQSLISLTKKPAGMISPRVLRTSRPLPPGSWRYSGYSRRATAPERSASVSTFRRRPYATTSARSCKLWGRAPSLTPWPGRAKRACCPARVLANFQQSGFLVNLDHLNKLY